MSSTAFTHQASRKWQEITVFAIAAVLITQFLFFIDEGYYDFRWMQQLGNWVVFGIYGTFLFFGQWISGRILRNRIRGWAFWTLSIFGGCTLGFLAAIGLIFTGWMLR